MIESRRDESEEDLVTVGIKNRPRWRETVEDGGRSQWKPKSTMKRSAWEGGGRGRGGEREEKEEEDGDYFDEEEEDDDDESGGGDGIDDYMIGRKMKWV